jgi:DNA repair exonuclease SbcCD ATPase subunit
MEAAHITWRPLGQLFVERGLITQDELEEALVEQQETRKRLGAILVSRGLVSGPELTSVLVDQLGMELTKESGFGSGLWDEIRRRHPRGAARGDGNTPQTGRSEHDESDPEAPEPEVTAPLAAVESRAGSESPAAEPPPLPDPEKLEASLAKERAALAVAFDEERAELQAALSAERTALEQALEEERAGRQQALQELMQVRADSSSRTTELEELARQVTELRTQVEKSTAAVAAEQKAVERVRELEAQLEAEQRSAARVEELERELAAEQAKRREHAEELDFARSEASVEAKELRASIDKIRAELERLDAATSWFEYWSGAASPPGQDEG